MAPVTIVWNVASANAKGIRNHFAVALLDAQGRMRARLADAIRPGRLAPRYAWRTCFVGCAVSISVANMNYALVGYTGGVAR